ncbi:MAG: nucleotidyltransferase family protein [Bacteroidales bacterium]
MENKITLLVLAAGMGSRYGGLKQVDKIGPAGETITDYSVFDAKRAGFDKVVFVIRKSIEADFREIFQRIEKHMEVEYVFQELDAVPPGIQISTERTKPWGTGHAVWVARKAINTPFAVINADDFYGAQSYRVVADFLKDGTIPEKDKYCMIGFPLRNTLSEFGHVSRGICEVDEHQFLKGIVERTKIQYTADKSSIIFYDENEQPHLLSGNETVSMNFWGFSPAIFDFLEKQFDEFIRLNAQNTKAEFYLPTSVNELIRAKSIKVKVLNSPDSWFGVTYKEDRDVTIQRIRQLIEKGQYPSQLWR